MNNRGIVSQLQRLGREANARVPELNCGGCAVYAALVSRALLKRGILARARVADRYQTGEYTVDKVRAVLAENGIDTNNATPDDWHAEGISFTHVLVEFEYCGRTYLADSNFVDTERLKREPTCGAPLLPGVLSVPEVESLASTPDGWNAMFDRDEGIPILKQLVAAHLGEEASC